MATQTNRTLVLDVVSVTDTGNSLALNADMHTVILQARGAAVQLKLGAVGDTEYYTLSDAQPQSFSDPALAGTTLYFDVASGSHNVEVLQMLKTSA